MDFYHVFFPWISHLDIAKHPRKHTYLYQTSQKPYIFGPNIPKTIHILDLKNHRNHTYLDQKSQKPYIFDWIKNPRNYTYLKIKKKQAVVWSWWYVFNDTDIGHLSLKEKLDKVTFQTQNKNIKYSLWIICKLKKKSIWIHVILN